MILTALMFIVALCLSAVAAFYSIVGLTAIFAAATFPIILMGSILEVAKLVVTVWLHEYWKQCKLTMKLYLVPAVGVLMLITSMGIFGFLSKAHMDQGITSGDVQAKIAIFDEKIKTERDNIDANRKALKQLDDAVDQVMGRSTDERGAEKAVQIRRSQQAERGRLLKEIEQSQKRIAALNEERAPIAAEVRKVEAEVGPIKYIAALVYGDNPDANLLERAVRWVIIILVFVFDPLAVIMLLASTESRKWYKQSKQEQEKQSVDVPVAQSDAIIDESPPVEPPVEPPAEPPKSLLEEHPYLTKPFKHFEGLKPMVYRPTDDTVNVPVAEQEKIIPDEVLSVYNDERLVSKFDKIDPVEPIVEHEDEDDEHDDPALKAAKNRWKYLHPGETLKSQRHLLARGAIDRLPWEVYLDQPQITYGKDLPEFPIKGDMFVNTITMPTQLYKYNGETWIEVDKNKTDAYAYDESYISNLIERVSSGEYDPELLTDSERYQIEQRIRQEI